jgi:hypothetical protein
MNEQPQTTPSALGAMGLDDVLSRDTETRRIELAFLELFISAAVPHAAERSAIEDEVSAQLARMRSPLFGALAACLARGVSAREGFGPFRGRK